MSDIIRLDGSAFDDPDVPIIGVHKHIGLRDQIILCRDDLGITTGKMRIPKGYELTPKVLQAIGQWGIDTVMKQARKDGTR